MTLSRVVVLPWKVIRLMKYCLPSLIRMVTLTLSPSGFELRVRCHFEVTAGPVDFLDLLKAFANLFLVVVVAGPHLEERPHDVGGHLVVAGELELVDLVPQPLGDRNFERHVPLVAVLRVANRLEGRLADVDLQVTVITVERHDHFGVFLELVFLIDAAARKDPEAAALVGLHFARESSRR